MTGQNVKHEFFNEFDIEAERDAVDIAHEVVYKM